MNVRAKFYVTKIEQTIGYAPSDETDSQGRPVYKQKPIDTVVMSPVMGEENKRFWTSSPSGELRLGMTNPEVSGLFELGKHYYIDFTPAPATEPK